MVRLKDRKQVTHIAIVLLGTSLCNEPIYLLSRDIDGKYVKEGVIFLNVTTEEIVEIANIMAAPYEASVVNLGLLEKGQFFREIDQPFIYEIPQIILVAGN